jgi:predicted naringenin-chalcone synthase
MNLAILGLGKALPPAAFTQEEGMKIAQALCCRTPEHVTWLPVMYAQTGIDTRYTCLGRPLIDDLVQGTRHSGSVFLPKDKQDDKGPTTQERMKIYAEESVPLAVRAAKEALAASLLRPEEVTHLITVSCTGFFAPGIDFSLIDQLGLKPTVQRTHIGYMGCHGAINGLRVAAAYAGADPRARVLLCAVELSSLHYHYGWDPQRIVANAIFGDGAAALVGVPVEARQPWTLAETCSCVLPASAEAMTWTISDHGFEMTLSKQVPGLIGKHLGAWIRRQLGEYGLAIVDVPSWAIHPGGPRILSAVEETLGLAPEMTSASREIFRECGNMSSPTVLFILDRLRQRNAPRPVVAIAFGPGLVAEMALIR